jgi:hypothetical protein
MIGPSNSIFRATRIAAATAVLEIPPTKQAFRAQRAAHPHIPA